MLRRVISATGLQLGSMGLMLLDRLVLSALLLRIWGVAVFEDWSLLFAAAGLLNLLDLGLHMTFGNVYAQAYQAGDKARFRRLLAIALATNLALAVVGLTVLACVIASGIWMEAIAVTGLLGAPGQAVLLMLGGAIILQTAAGATSTIYRAQGRFSRGLAFDLVANAVRLLSVAGVALVGAGPVAAAATYLAATAVFALGIVPFDLRRNLDGVAFSLVLPRRGEIAGVAAVAPWFFAQHASNVFLLGLPLLVLGRLTEGIGTVAMFVLLRTIVNFARQLIQILANSIAVELSTRWMAAARAHDVRAELLKSSRFIAVLSGAILGSLLPLLAPLCSVWSGGTVDADLGVALALSLGFVLTAPCAVVAAYLNYIGEARVGAYSRIVTAGVALLAGLLVVGPLGAFGLASALAFGEIVGLGMIYLPSAARWTGVPPLRLAATWLAYVTAGVVPSALMAAGAVAVLSAPPLLVLSVSALLLAPVVGLSLLWLGLSARDRGQALAAATQALRWSHAT